MQPLVDTDGVAKGLLAILLERGEQWTKTPSKKLAVAREHALLRRQAAHRPNSRADTRTRAHAAASAALRAVSAAAARRAVVGTRQWPSLQPDFGRAD